MVSRRSGRPSDPTEKIFQTAKIIHFQAFWSPEGLRSGLQLFSRVSGVVLWPESELFTSG